VAGGHEHPSASLHHREARQRHSSAPVSPSPEGRRCPPFRRTPGAGTPLRPLLPTAHCPLEPTPSHPLTVLPRKDRPNLRPSPEGLRLPFGPASPVAGHNIGGSSGRMMPSCRSWLDIVEDGLVEGVGTVA
jgi:hypothetical protein